MEAFGFFGAYYIAGANCNWWAACDPKDKVHREEWLVKLPGEAQTGKWYRIGIDLVGDSISYYIDGELQYQVNDKLHSSGGVALFAYDAIVEFDNIVITGDDIPDAGPSGYAIQPKTGLVTTWGRLKR